MPYSTANGLRIYYQVSGEGPAFVLVHANPFDHRLWLYQIAQFSSYFRASAWTSAATAVPTKSRRLYARRHEG